MSEEEKKYTKCRTIQAVDKEVALCECKSLKDHMNDIINLKVFKIKTKYLLSIIIIGAIAVILALIFGGVITGSVVDGDADIMPVLFVPKFIPLPPPPPVPPRELYFLLLTNMLFESTIYGGIFAQVGLFGYRVGSLMNTLWITALILGVTLIALLIASSLLSPYIKLEKEKGNQEKSCKMNLYKSIINIILGFVVLGTLLITSFNIVYPIFYTVNIPAEFLVAYYYILFII